MNRWLARSAQLSICLALAACTDLAAVRTISTKLQTATTSWNEVGGEFLGSCQREQRTNTALVDCAVQKEASEGLTATNKVLSDYFKALGAAATETNFTIQPGLDKATASAAKIPGISGDQVKAVSGIVGLLARLVTERMREAVLRDLIDNGAPQARTIVGAMNALVVDNLRTRLETERTQLGGIFLAKIMIERNSVPGPIEDLCKGATATTLNGTGYLLALEYCRHVEVLDKRVAALDDYRKSLAAADAALETLQSNKTKLKGKELLGKLFAIGQELDDKIGAVRKAFA